MTREPFLLFPFPLAVRKFHNEDRMESIPQNGASVLVVDDDEGLLLSIRATLMSAGLPEPALLSDSRKVLELLRRFRFALVLQDLIMPHISGMEVLQRIKEEFPSVECIVVTAVDDVASAVQAMKLGAYDYLVKPVNGEKMMIAIHRALERHSLRNSLALYEKPPSFSDIRNPEAFREMVARDSSMAMVFRQAEIAAPTDYNVVITGESGTGKELLARIIHRLSVRREGPFIAVNMASFNRNLFEDEFFGHVRGAYTGATHEKKGFFEAAREGTLFLDEITELDPALQGKFLRVIQEREFYRLGSTELRDVNVRIVSATNADLRTAIENGRLRRDLFYRLNMFHIHIPPLRERKDDILPLAYHFLRLHGEKNNKNIIKIKDDLEKALVEWDYPGNVRELEHIVAKAVLLEKQKELTLFSMEGHLRSPRVEMQEPSREMTLAEVEKEHILRVLASTGQNRTRAAKILGIGLRTLHRKLKDLK